MVSSFDKRSGRGLLLEVLCVLVIQVRNSQDSIIEDVDSQSSVKGLLGAYVYLLALFNEDVSKAVVRIPSVFYLYCYFLPFYAAAEVPAAVAVGLSYACC